MAYYVHEIDPDTFNGAFVFGGGSAPVLDSSDQPLSQITNITALEQYRRANLNLAAGIPTTFQITTGNPLVAFNQCKVSLFAEDAIKLTPRLTLTTGLRYQFQTSPSNFLNFAPRLGLAWAFGKNDSTVLHARIGLFNSSNYWKPELLTCNQHPA
ncbi:TonB-dependent receptor domain-containing protein [Acidisarcina polymorpha]|uniref:TonB-dependent receptor domain-containing protein n=1 Tax=Acidisarcina polymorpha TaxID=2211140 RepID=UPI001374A4D5|nr:TonB-dependent receptor [Acidisarcina polymorpha]